MGSPSTDRTTVSVRRHTAQSDARSACGQPQNDTINGMRTTTKWLAAGAVTVVAAAGATGVALAGGSGDEPQQRPITGSAYDRATAVALHETGGGRVTETEADDEESYYQVEVTKDDGSQVDVNLDRSFKVVKTKVDREDSSDSAGG